MTTPPDDLAWQTRVTGDLVEFVARQRTRLAPLGPDIVSFVDAAAAFVERGKRLRPEFCFAGWCAAGGDPDDRRISWAASSFEWLQASALVHDDIMDGSDTRRGKPAVHRAFESDHRTAGGEGEPERYGMAAAILLGDLMLSWADEMFRTSGFALDAVERAAAFLDACKTEVVAGQFLDVIGQTKADTSFEDAMRIVRYKSAKYTIERPLHVGAALAGADDQMIGRLSAFGLPLGEAFQLRDDVLGVFGDPAITGKPAGDDVRDGKRTVLIARTLELSGDDGRELLRRGLGRVDHVAEVADLIRSSGALEQVEHQIAALEEQAATALDHIGEGPARDHFHDLLLRSTRRSH